MNALKSTATGTAWVILGLMFAGAFAQAPSPPAGMAVSVLLRTTVSGDESREAIVASATLQPGATTGHHTHPGDEYGTLLEGELEIRAAGQAPLRVRAGEAYHNSRNVVHETRNVGEGVARIVSTFIISKGERISVPAG